MWYLFFQIWVWLVAAFALGWFAHWFFCCRDKERVEDSPKRSLLDSSLSAISEATSIDDNSEQTAPDDPAMVDSWKPQGFAQAPDQVDDLKRIKGVGAVLENTLNELGIYQFKQIAQWDSDNVAWVDNFLSFSGRISREDWIGQAQALSKGETTEFAAKVDKGDVDYD